jgi:hypothetical protein
MTFGSFPKTDVQIQRAIDLTEFMHIREEAALKLKSAQRKSAAQKVPPALPSRQPSQQGLPLSKIPETKTTQVSHYSLAEALEKVQPVPTRPALPEKLHAARS